MIIHFKISDKLLHECYNSCEFFMRSVNIDKQISYMYIHKNKSTLIISLTIIIKTSIFQIYKYFKSTKNQQFFMNLTQI
jgi:hypothetical protein